MVTRPTTPLGTLAQAEPREGYEAVREQLCRRAGGYTHDGRGAEAFLR